MEFSLRVLSEQTSAEGQEERRKEYEKYSVGFRPSLKKKEEYQLFEACQLVRSGAEGEVEMEITTRKGYLVSSLDLEDRMLTHPDYTPAEMAMWNLTGKLVRVLATGLVLRPSIIAPVADYQRDAYGVEVGEGESKGIIMYPVEGENTDGFLSWGEFPGFPSQRITVIFKSPSVRVVVPMPHENRVYLVRWHLAQSVPDRRDVFFPYPVVRETADEIVCKGFGTVCSDWQKPPFPEGIQFEVSK